MEKSHFCQQHVPKHRMMQVSVVNVILNLLIVFSHKITPLRNYLCSHLDALTRIITKNKADPKYEMI